ncbi:MAG: polysaccharide ABC transporter ATP-binding protein [Candidatus Sumerlaeia bacterium]
MSRPAISIHDLGKLYKLGGTLRHDTLRDKIADGVNALLRRGTAGEKKDERDFWALRHVSFEVEEGTAVALIGRNGAGKSTLLKLLSQITEPTEGEVRLRGRVASLLEVGTGFHPELSGRENIMLNGAILGMTRREIKSKFDEIVAFAEVERFLDTPVKRYSSGMYVRLAFAVAAHLEPEILLIDEVLAVGDAAFQKKCLGKMNSVARDGRTVIFVSHNMVAVRNLCQRAVMLEGGGLAVDGEVNDVVSRYLGGDQHDDRPERVWEDPARAPGDRTLRLHRVCVYDKDGRIDGDIRIEEPFRIAIEYWVTRAGIRAGATAHVWNEDSTLVFSSISNNDEWHTKIKPEGLYRTWVNVPGNFLNAGRHSVSVELWKENYDRSTREDEVLHFHVNDTGGVRGDFMGKFRCATRPDFQWETQCLSEEKVIAWR